MTAWNEPDQHVSDALAEFALDILDGRRRAEVLAHLDHCPRCSSELEELAQASDALLHSTPSLDPPLGFEVRVLDAIRPRRAPRPRRHLLALAVAAVIAFGAGVGIGGLVSSAASGRAATTDLLAGALVDNGRTLGAAIAYGGRSGWLLVSVNGISTNAPVTCTIRVASGRTIDLGQFWLAGGSGSWTVRLPVQPGAVRSVVLSTGPGKPVGRAVLVD